MISIRIENLTKRFGDSIALHSLNLTIGAGEIFFLLGPSGCGKTTLLRSIAGFYPPCSDLTDDVTAPVLLLLGAADDWTSPVPCVQRAEAAGKDYMIEHLVYPNATHGWDRLEPEINVNDPYSHLGKGGEVRIAPNEAAAAASRAATGGRAIPARCCAGCARAASPAGPAASAW